MDLRDVLARLDEERRSLHWPGERAEMLADVTRRWPDDGSFQMVGWSCLTRRTADAVIRREIEHHRAIGKAFEWKLFGHDLPADLKDRLRLHRFEIGAHEAVLIYDLSRPRDWILEEGTAPARRLDSKETIGHYRQVADPVFGKPFDFTTAQLQGALEAGSNHHLGYAAYVDERPVSIGRLYMHPESWFAGLYGGGTLAEFRGRGHYRKTVAARARDAIGFGAKYLIVDALPTSRPVLEKLGFVHLTDTWPCEWRLS